VKLVEEIVRVAVAEPPLTNTLVWLSVAVRPEELDTANVTVPVNPLTALTVTVEVALPPAGMDIAVGLVVSVKSVTMNVTVTE